MKGPGGRLRFDLRRVWECPLCHRKEWTGGDVVYRLCTCSAKTEPPRQVWMKLIEPDDAPSAPPPPPPLSPPAEQVGAAAPVAAQPTQQPTTESCANAQSPEPTPPDS